MSFEQANKQRQRDLSNIKIKGKSPEKLKELLIQYSHGLAESLYKKYHKSPRLHMLLPELGDYQSLVYQACLKTVDVYDYFRWKNHGDLKAKARIKKWRNGHGKEFLPRGKHRFNHLGHLYGYMFLTADNLVRMNIESLMLNKRNGFELYPSQLKIDGTPVWASTEEAIMGPADNQDIEAKLFHREVISLLPQKRILPYARKSLNFGDLYYLRYVEERTLIEVAQKTGHTLSSINEQVKKLNERLIPIIQEREAA